MGTTGTSGIIEGDYRRYSPFRRPDWRWKLAEALYARGGRPAGWEDPAIGAALHYQRAGAFPPTERGLPPRRDRTPAMAAAQEIYLDGGTVRDEIEARLLAAESFEAIAAKVGAVASCPEAPPADQAVTAEVIALYETYFFNVAQSLHATGWLLAQAIGIHPALPRALTERDVWCYWALGGGPVVVDLLVADYHGRPEPNLPDRHRQAERARFLVREYVADWSSREAGAAILEEGCRLFGPRWGITGSEEEMELLDVHMQFLRTAYAPEPPPPGTGKGRRGDDRGKQTKATGRRNAPKERTHGRG